MLGSLTFALLATAAAATPCESLRALATPQAMIATANEVPAGPFVQPGGRGAAPQGGAAAPAAQPIPRHCRVTLVLKPTSDSNINSELWMPADNWNGKLLVVGNGGFAGSIQGYGDMQIALRLGFATAATDTGHSRPTGPKACSRSAIRRRSWTSPYRAVHETTVKSKELIKAFYDRSPQYSYFKGCSTGGRRP